MMKYACLGIEWDVGWVVLLCDVVFSHMCMFKYIYVVVGCMIMNFLMCAEYITC